MSEFILLSFLEIWKSGDVKLDVYIIIMQRRILNKDPHARITLPSIMEHAWLTQSSLPALHSLSRSDPQAAEATVPISPHELQAAYTTNTSGMEMLFNVGLEERTYEPGEYIVREVTATSCQD